MRADEKYNWIIKRIEEYVREKPYKRSSEILSCLMQENGYYAKQREFNAIFEFINGQLPLKYISGRQMMHAYECMMKYKKYEEVDMSRMLDITCMSDQPAFIKAFKNRFGNSPKKAFNEANNNPDSNKYKAPEYWGTFDNAVFEEVGTMKTEVSNQIKDTFFGIDKETYERIITLQNMTAVYGCSNEAAEAAFRFHEEFNVALDEAFEYASKLAVDQEQIKEDFEVELKCGRLPEDINTFEKYYISDLLSDMKDKTTMHCHFDLGLSVDDSADISFRGRFERVDFSEIDLPHAFAMVYLGNIRTTREIFTITDTYIEMNNDDDELDYSQFTDFLDLTADLSFEQILDGGAVEFAYTLSTLSADNILENERHGDPYQNFMLEQEYKLEAGLSNDEDRREGWMYYKNPHKYGLDDANDDESETDKDGIWDEFTNARYYTDDDVLDDMEELYLDGF